jgi:predicted enzyme related to lactoylglutathione lyase
MTMARIDFIELPTKNKDQAKVFYSQAFGWSLTDFGPTYSCTMTGDVDLGLQGDSTEATSAPLVVIAVENLEMALAAVQKAGGVITKPIFSFPGGRRFHFRDPSGNELSAHKSD